MRSKLRTPMLAISAFLIVFPSCIVDFDFSFNINDFRYRFDDWFETGLEGIENVSIEILQGQIIIETWESDRIEIDVEERIKSRDEEDAKEIADGIKLVGRRHGSTLEIEPDYGDFFHLRKRYLCNLKVKLPEKMNLKLGSTNGLIDVEQMDGDIKAETTNGKINVRGSKGDVDLITTNGFITARSVEGRLNARTTNGGLSLESVNGNIYGRTTNGRVEAEILDTLRGDVELATTNGSIECRIHRDSDCRIKASTTNGTVSDALDRRRFRGEYNRRRTSLNGRLGNGTYRIILSTTNGAIRVE